MDDEGPPTVMIPARRILVADDLGQVRKGDHVLMVSNVIVSVDTSRQISDVNLTTYAGPKLPMPKPATPSAKPPTPRPSIRKMRTIHDVTSELVLQTIRQRAPITSIKISDSLNLDRKDGPARSKVTRMIGQLLQSGQIHRHEGTFRYYLGAADAASEPESESASASD